jgi:CheY-like chemotaxis protein
MAEDVKVILVVDDSKTARMMIRSIILHLHPNWIVLEAGSGAEALEVVERDTPNCITMDVNMPGMDGIEAARMILGKYPGTRIVLFTANLQESTRQEAQAMGMNFVAKPVTEQSVTQALSALGG